MSEEVVEPDGRYVPAQRLERHPVVPRRELELLEADPFVHGRTVSQDAYDPRTFTARAVTSTTAAIEIADSSPISSFAWRLKGIASVGLNAMEFVSER